MSKRTKYSKGKKAPPFIAKLYEILEDHANMLIIKWRQDEQSFIILNIPRFSQIILPKHYKHSNFSSFVRQLHMYNFTKMRVQIQGEHVYKNQMFYRGNSQNLKQIRRKEVNNGKNSLLALTNNLNNQIQSNIDQQSILERQNSFSMAAPSQIFDQNPLLIRQNSPFLNPSFQFQSINLEESNYPIPINILPNVIPLPSNDNHLEYLQNILTQMKQSQNQLQEICLSLYKQNKTLITQNKLLQQKVCRQWQKKQKNLNQIMNYVVEYLQQWSNQQPYYDYKQEDLEKDQNFQFNDVILESYNLVTTKNRKCKNASKRFQNCNSKANMFKKYSKSDLISFLKEIQAIFRSNVHFSQLFEQKQSVQSNFLTMIMKFVQNNELNQIFRAFSMFVNIQRNRKKKNFTVIEKKQKKQIQRNEDYPSKNQFCAIQLQYLEQERKSIKQMQKQIFMIEECQQNKYSNSGQKNKNGFKSQKQMNSFKEQQELKKMKINENQKMKDSNQQFEMNQILNNFKYFLEQQNQ